MDFFNRKNEGVNELTGRLHKEINLFGFGNGASNASRRNGIIEDTADLKWKESVPFLEKLKRPSDVPMWIGTVKKYKA